MKANILMIVIGMAVLSSCSTAYKSGQTPDDVYYSPSKPVLGGGGEEYLAVDNIRDKYSPNDDYDTYRNDRWLRMSIGSRYRLSAFDNYYWNDWRYNGFYPGFSNFGYSPWGYNSFGYGSFGYLDPWSGPLYWNSFYNPYAFNYGYGWGGWAYPGGSWSGVGGGKTPIYREPSARPTVFNPRTYGLKPTTTNSSRRTYYNPRTGNYSNYNNTNSGTNTRTSTRRSNETYYNTNSNSNSNSERYTPSTERPSRSYTPAPSSGNSNSGSRGNSGGGEVRRPTRGN